MILEVFIDMMKQKEFHLMLLTIIAGVVYFKWKESRKGDEIYKKWKASQGLTDCE